jgi:hypothetical protein
MKNKTIKKKKREEVVCRWIKHQIFGLTCTPIFEFIRVALALQLTSPICVCVSDLYCVDV